MAPVHTGLRHLDSNMAVDSVRIKLILGSLCGYWEVDGWMDGEQLPLVSKPDKMGPKSMNTRHDPAARNSKDIQRTGHIEPSTEVAIGDTFETAVDKESMEAQQNIARFDHRIRKLLVSMKEQAQRLVGDAGGFDQFIDSRKHRSLFLMTKWNLALPLKGFGQDWRCGLAPRLDTHLPWH